MSFTGDQGPPLRSSGQPQEQNRMEPVLQLHQGPGLQYSQGAWTNSHRLQGANSKTRNAGRKCLWTSTKCSVFADSTTGSLRNPRELSSNVPTLLTSQLWSWNRCIHSGLPRAPQLPAPQPSTYSHPADTLLYFGEERNGKNNEQG